MQTRRWVWIVFVGVGVACAIAVIVAFTVWGRTRDTLVSVSPDGTCQVVVREGPRWSVDRNFRLFLADRKTGAERPIFTSDDQSPLITRERLVWSEDSSRFTLVGDRYFAVPEANLPSGEIVFLVYDIPGQKLRCNTDAEDRKSYERISGVEATAIFGKALEANSP